MKVNPTDRVAQPPPKKPALPIRRLLIAAVLIASAVGTYVSFKPNAGSENEMLTGGAARDKQPMISPNVFSRLGGRTRVLAERLIEMPCNRTVALQLMVQLRQLAEYPTMVSVERTFRNTCGMNKDLLYPLLQAQLLSSDFASAARTADELILTFPTDPNVWGWRADVREKVGDVQGAVDDWHRTLLAFPDPAKVALSVYYSTARAEARAGRPCDAVLTIRDYLAFDPRQRRNQRVDGILRDFSERGSCPPPFGQGTSTSRYDPRAASVVVTAEINNVPTRVVVDTGASRTVLNAKLAALAGVEVDRKDGSMVMTGKGVTWLPGGRVRRMAVGTAVAHDVPVYILSDAGVDLGGGAEALLGLSFLGNFEVRLSGGTLELKPLE